MPGDPRSAVTKVPIKLIRETRQPLPARPGQPPRYDSEYKREGTVNLFLFVQPLAGWPQVTVTAQRTTQDFAQQRQALVAVYCPKAEGIRLVMDNLNIHTPALCTKRLTPPKPGA